MDVCRERFQGLDRCVYVGGLGVVVVLYAANRGYIFQPVLDSFEVTNGFGDTPRIATRHRADANGGQHILDVVASLERNLRRLHDLALALGIAKKDAAIADVRALLDLFLAAEPEDLRPGTAGEICACGIVRV